MTTRDDDDDGEATEVLRAQLRAMGRDALVEEVIGLTKALILCHTFLRDTSTEYPGSVLEEAVSELLGESNGTD